MPMLFKNGVSAQDLERGVEFQVDDDAYQSSSSEDEYFDDAASNAFKSEMAKLKVGEGDLENELENLSLEELKERMTPITDDNLVLKLMLNPGTGVEIPTKSIVSMHYEGTFEGQSEPFDSTYKRNKPHRFLFNSQMLIRGLDIGVSTMRVGECAKFWVHHTYAYGPMGCPPRIPAEANAIYKVEILNFIDSSAAVEFEEMTPEDQRNAPFEKVYEVCKVEHQAGNEMFKNKKFTAAVSRYQRARKLLEFVNVKNEEEDKKRLKLLQKLYLNLAIAYFKLKKSNRVIFHSRKAIELDEVNVKALFYMGRGLMLENEFERARDYLHRAKRLAPYDSAINDELRNLEDRRQKYIALDRDFCQKMFGTSGKKSEVVSAMKNESPEFIQVIKDRIEKFKTSSDTEYVFASTYTPTQIEVIKEISKSLNCHFVEIIFQGQKLIKITKIGNE